ncbi:MAG: flagellar protein FlgN [Myxococcales bacterium]|nr:flagellar protein FlgN [Myxococcales bacterium]
MNDVTDRVESLERLLEDQETISERLLAVMERERRATIDLDLDTLREALFEKETLITTLGAMERMVVQYLRDEAGEDPSGDPPATVTEVIERRRAEIGEPSALRLIARRDRVRGLHRRIRELGEHELRLVEHSLHSMDLSLRIIRNRIEPDRVYSPSGRMRSSQELRLFHRGA